MKTIIVTTITLYISLSLAHNVEAIEDTPADTTNTRAECQYNKEAKLLKCHGKSGEFECETDFKWYEPETEFNYFGIGMWSESPAEMKFRLVPRKIDNSAWSRDFIKSDGVDKYFSLYFSDKINDFGMKVKDSKCFDKVVELFKSSLRHEKVSIESEDEKDYSAWIVGDMVFIDTTNSKRAGYGGYGYGGYGYGGYGYYDLYAVYGGYGGYGGYGYGYYKRNANKADDFEGKLGQLNNEMKKGWAIADQNTEHMAKEIEFLRGEIEMLKADMDDDSNVVSRRSAWSKPHKVKMTKPIKHYSKHY